MGRAIARASSDEDVLGRIRELLEALLFLGRGHWKLRARRRHAGVRTSSPRVLRLMREPNLLAPTRQIWVGGPRNHDGPIVTKRPDEIWGTDATTNWPGSEDYLTVFAAVDHSTLEGAGIHPKPGTAYETLKPIRQGVKDRFGSYGEQSPF